jgi:hypothetical protein
MGLGVGGSFEGKRRMKKILGLSALSWILLPAVAWAQEAVQAPASAVVVEPQQPAEIVQSTEAETGKPTTYIRHTDSGSTIEEVREGADTKSISVKPHNAAPQYQIVPETRSGQPGHYGNQGGKRVWKVLSF